MGEKKVAEAYILGVPFGLCGAHHFYLKRKIFGIVYACTLGMFGLGYLFDLVRMRWLVKHANRYGSDRRMISDGYLICMLGGLFGAHHFYLGNKKLGIFYACTLGVFLVGWIVDLIRMRSLVRAYNEGREGKSLGTAYILGLSPLGIFGSYHYYLGNVKLGLIYTFTLGIFGIGWIVDLFRMKKLVRKAGMDKKSVGTAYIMAVPPFGLFGAYHYYLGNYVLGLTYTFTLGIFGIGWVVDLFRMKGLVEAANDPTSDHGMTKITAYVLCVSPLGIFGLHHFYLKRYLNGGFYAATLGLFGFGWVFDMFRLPVLYQRYAEEDKHKYADEAYVYWFPFGLFGLHHFYLGRKPWGILYACTFGCFLFGWIIDGFRLPSLIKEYNDTVHDPDRVPFRICRPKCSVYKFRRCCMNLFSTCECFERFSLVRTRSESQESSNATRSNGHARDDFEVIKEMYPDEHIQMTDPNQQNIANQNQMNIATVGNSHDQAGSIPNSNENENQYTSDVNNGAYPDDAPYDANAYSQNNEYPPPYEGNGNQTNEHAQNDYYQEGEGYSDDVIRNPDDVGVTVHSDQGQYNESTEQYDQGYDASYNHDDNYEEYQNHDNTYESVANRSSSEADWNSWSHDNDPNSQNVGQGHVYDENHGHHTEHST